MQILKFYASWCNPCKQQSKVLEEMTLSVPIVNIDIDDNHSAAIEHGIRGVPCMILMDDNNNILTRLNGLQTKKQIEDAINPYIKI